MHRLTTALSSFFPVPRPRSIFLDHMYHEVGVFLSLLLGSWASEILCFGDLSIQHHRAELFMLDFHSLCHYHIQNSFWCFDRQNSSSSCESGRREGFSNSKSGLHLLFDEDFKLDFRLLLESLALSDVAHKPATETCNTRNQVSEAKTKFMLKQPLQPGDKNTIFRKSLWRTNLINLRWLVGIFLA